MRELFCLIIRSAFFVPLFIWCAFVDPFQAGDDPSEVHHVNVISGKVRLLYDDQVVNGAVPISLSRTYVNSYLSFRSPVSIPLGTGWEILPHMSLLFCPDEKIFNALLNEPSGHPVRYQGNYSRKHPFVLTPIREQNVIVRNYRDDPSNNKLYVDYKKGEAILYLADGGQRIYQGSKKTWRDKAADRLSWQFTRYDRIYRLQKEISPSGQKTLYQYFDDKKQVFISKMNPDETKTYSWIKIEEYYGGLQVTTSDRQVYYYYKDRLEKRFGPTQKLSYAHYNDSSEPPYLERIKEEGRPPLEFHYYFPTKKELYSPNLPAHIYKAKAVYKEKIPVAHFTYEKDFTDVLSPQGTLTRYHHKEGLIREIEHFDQHQDLYSIERFLWDKGRLTSRSLHYPDGELVFSTSSEYDHYGNVTKEIIRGNLRGESSDDEKIRSYTYNQKHLLIEERDESGYSCCYTYLRDTDLPTSKTIYADGEWIFEERYHYDNDRLLIEKKVFDGKHEVTDHYKRDSQKGVIVEHDNGLKKTHYTYDKALRVIQEESNGYSVETIYDDLGRIYSKSLPLGGKSVYCHDIWGNLTHVHEIGSPRKEITYDTADRPIRYKQCGKESSLHYDPYGRVVQEVDYKKDTTHFTYDEFNRILRKTLPDGHHIEYEYDIQGNISLEKAPNGGETRTEYTILRKPYHITRADGSEIIHHYNLSGELLETTHPDGTKTTYTYDPLHRLLSKTQGGIREEWTYEGLLLKSYKNDLLITYDYDQYGRKIREQAEGRCKTFHYDRFGFLEKVQEGDLYQEEVHDVEGKIVETNQNGFHRTKYLYNDDRLKIKAIKGDAEDHFHYNEERKIICHIDPLGHETRFTYDDYKTTITDPQGSRTIEILDSMSRVTEKRKESPSGDLLLKELFTYDEMGELITRTSEGKTTTLTRDIMGRLIKEEEPLGKTTSYDYDIKGRLIAKTSPNGTILYRHYDDLDRMIELRSSDGELWYEYHYDHLNLRKVEDLLLQKSVERTYNKFGELETETGLFGHIITWDRDNYGRVTRITLPDHTSIGYSYEGSSMKSVSRFTQRGDLTYQHRYKKFDPNQHIEEEELGSLGTIHTKRDLLERPYQMSSPYHTISLSYDSLGLINKDKNSLLGNKEYHYDSLRQLTKENETQYLFDSLGNPKDSVINDLNQIILSGSESFQYDANGNLIQRDDKEYIYDPLNRLKEIHHKDGKITRYTYDPFSRLIKKDQDYYLYNQDFEIGRIDRRGVIDQLRILGLGIKGEIGAAILIELDQEPYIPLHDLQGSIIALLDMNSNIIESYDHTAFGQEEPLDHLSPWRFSSKRHDGPLIFFGLRFYDPSLKRFITPDPAGYIDGPNLYAFTLNSPINRLDLFGLDSEMRYPIPGCEPKLPCNPYPPTYKPYPSPVKWTGTADLSGTSVDIAVICSRPYTFTFSPEEMATGTFNLFDRLGDFLQGADGQIDLVTYENGINTSRKEWLRATHYLAHILPQGTLLISIYNPTTTLLGDIYRCFRERCGFQSTSSRNLTKFHATLLDLLETHAPTAFALHIAHSEGGVIYNRSFENHSDENQGKMQKYFYCEGIAPAQRIPRMYGRNPKSTYSEKDFITGQFALIPNEKYDVVWVKPETSWVERFGGIAEHSIMGKTYQSALKNIIENYQKEKGFYVGSTR